MITPFSFLTRSDSDDKARFQYLRLTRGRDRVGFETRVKFFVSLEFRLKLNSKQKC